jgi:threonine/homoserine efflux transporter RhtA
MHCPFGDLGTHAGQIPANALAGVALVIGGLVLLGLAAATVGTVITFGTDVWLLKRVSPPLVATDTFVNPIVAVALGLTVLGESPTVDMLGGDTLVLGSLVVLMSLDPPTAKRKPAKEKNHAARHLNARCPATR